MLCHALGGILVYPLLDKCPKPRTVCVSVGGTTGLQESLLSLHQVVHGLILGNKSTEDVPCQSSAFTLSAAICCVLLT